MKIINKGYPIQSHLLRQKVANQTTKQFTYLIYQINIQQQQGCCPNRLFRPTDVGAFSTTTPSSVCRGSSSTCVAAVASLTTATAAPRVYDMRQRRTRGTSAAADIFSFNRDRIPERIWRDRSPAIILLRKKNRECQ